MKDNFEEVLFHITNKILFRFIHSLSNFLVVTSERLKNIAQQNTALKKEFEPVIQNINDLEHLLYTFRYNYHEHLQIGDRWIFFKEDLGDKFFHDLSKNLLKIYIYFNKELAKQNTELFKEIKSNLETLDTIMKWKDFFTEIIYPVYSQDDTELFEVNEAIRSSIHYSRLHSINFIVEKKFYELVYIKGSKSLFILALYLIYSNIINTVTLTNKEIHISSSLNKNAIEIVIIFQSLRNFDFIKSDLMSQEGQEQLMFSKQIINDCFYGQFSFEKINAINRISIIQRHL